MEMPQHWAALNLHKMGLNTRDLNDIGQVYSMKQNKWR